MSENVNPETPGHESLSVEQAADRFLTILNPEEASTDQPQEEESVVEKTETQSELEAIAEDLDETETLEQDSEEPLQEETPQTFKVKAAGEEIEVTQDELIKSFQLEKDVRKKQESLAHERKEVEQSKQVLQQELQKAADAQQVRDTYAQRLQLLEQSLIQQNQAEDLTGLKENDPIQYAVKVAERQEQEKQLQVIQGERQRLAHEQQSQQQALLAEQMRIEAKTVLERFPERNDPEKAKAMDSEIRKAAMADGYTEAELNNIRLSKNVVTLWKAAQWDKLQNSKPEVQKKIAKAPKMMKAGATQSESGKSEQIKRLKGKLRKTGKVGDAAKLFEHLI